MRSLFLSGLVLCVGVFPVAADPPPTEQVSIDSDAVVRADVQRMIDSGLAFLKSKQKADGSWASPQEPPAISALVLRAFAKEPSIGPRADFVARGYANLMSFQLADGGIYRDLLANYNTAIAISALSAADDPAMRPAIDKAVGYLKSLQWTAETRPEYANDKEEFTGKQVVKDEADPFFGGFGYGGRSRGAGRPDLSNVQIALDALHEAGVDANDPAMRRAIVFLSRTQNFSETNDQSWAGNDGGFVYGPSADRRGESFAGEFIDDAGQRRLRSYGSMTYAGLKSFIHAGLTREDPRVKAAFAWIASNFTVDENPGMSAADPANAQYGLFYYFHTMARTLNLYDEPTLTLKDGTTVDWRARLAGKLAALQQPDGSWAGEKKWMENNPVLVTAYVVLSLQEIRDDLTKSNR
jgi:squalene-hopene/tetraprenyl-beta-curcumene cyclase